MIDVSPDISKRRGAYAEWCRRQGIPIVPGHHIADLREVPLKDWERVGGHGALIHHDGTFDSNDAHLVEIPAGDSLHSEKHLYQEIIYVLTGHGITEVWDDGVLAANYIWSPGALFSFPVNAQHRHRCVGDTPARFLALTNAPRVFALFEDESFVYGSSHRFPHAFTKDGRLVDATFEADFIEDVRTLPIVGSLVKNRTTMGLKLAGNSMTMHIGEFEPGKYKGAHRHGPGTHLIIVTGSGYALMWPEDGAHERYDWGANSLIIPPAQWYHHQFNTSSNKTRYLALRLHYRGPEIDLEHELPMVRDMYSAELLKAGVLIDGKQPEDLLV